jgi:hypothetical protein
MEDQKIYFLDLQTLLSYLRGQSCVLTSEISVAGKAGTGYITLRDGVVESCLVHFRDGSQLVGKAAYERLETCERWQVRLIRPEADSVSPPPPSQVSPAGPQLPSQRQTAPRLPAVHYPPGTFNVRAAMLPLKPKRMLDDQQLQNLPMRKRLVLRMVFAMVNGQRSTEEIKRQLQLPPDAVDEALAQLRMLNIIE